MNHLKHEVDYEYIVIIDIQSYGLFGHRVFYLFGLSVIYLVIQFSIYSVLWIHSNGPGRTDSDRLLYFL